MKLKLSIFILPLQLITLTDCIKVENCKQKMYDIIRTGRLFSDLLEYSGKYLNELGDYQLCTQKGGDYYYTLQILKATNVMNDETVPTYVVGNCMIDECQSDFLTYFDDIVYASPMSNIVKQSQY